MRETIIIEFGVVKLSPAVSLIFVKRIDRGFDVTLHNNYINYSNSDIIKYVKALKTGWCISDMVFEEYCSYILSREKEIEEFTIPGSNVTIEKSELISTMRSVTRASGYRSYDSLLMSTLRCYISKDRMAKNIKFDEGMDAVLSNIKKRTESIISLNSGSTREIPFSYEKVFEILVYYLRLITNILDTRKDKIVRYATAEISPEAIAFVLNRKLTLKRLGEEWDKNGWSAFYKDLKPISTDIIDYYYKYILLSTYIRYCEIKGIK